MLVLLSSETGDDSLAVFFAQAGFPRGPVHGEVNSIFAYSSDELA